MTCACWSWTTAARTGRSVRIALAVVDAAVPAAEARRLRLRGCMPPSAAAVRPGPHRRRHARRERLHPVRPDQADDDALRQHDHHDALVVRPGRRRRRVRRASASPATSSSPSSSPSCSKPSTAGARRRRPTDRPAPAAAPHPAVRPLQLLLAEDSLANQKLAVGLEGAGHAVPCAHNGRLAVEVSVRLLRRRPPGRADAQMDGLQATAGDPRVRSSGTGQRLPIIAMTAHAMTGDRDRCLATGMDAYVAKPIDATRLVELVETLASRPLRQGTGPEQALGAVVEVAEVHHDFDLWQSLARLGGDMGLFRKLVQFFNEDCPQLIEQVRAGIEAGHPTSGGAGLAQPERAGLELQRRGGRRGGPADRGTGRPFGGPRGRVGRPSGAGVRKSSVCASARPYAQEVGDPAPPSSSP